MAQVSAAWAYPVLAWAEEMISPAHPVAGWGHKRTGTGKPVPVCDRVHDLEPFVCAKPV
ncbi:MAG: hypothetical protein ABI042_13115 [Verrucomicrobiota bacterium]